LANLLIRSAPLIAFRETVHELGGNPERMLKEADLVPQVLDDPEIIITFDSYCRLLNLAGSSGVIFSLKSKNWKTDCQQIS